MSYQDHLKTCSFCREKYSQSRKPTVRVKSASSYGKRKKLTELGAIIRGTSYPSMEPILQAKGASVVRKPGPIEREVKLKALGKIIRGA